MAETYPSDAALNALSGTTDAEQEVQYPTTFESPYFNTFFRMLSRLLDVARRAGDLRVFQDGDLTYGVRAGNYFNDDTLVDFSAVAAQGINDEKTTYIYITMAGVLTESETSFPLPSGAPHIRLATIVTTGGEITSVTDNRGSAFVSVAGESSVNALTIYNGTGSQIDEGEIVSILGWNVANNTYEVQLADADTPLRPGQLVAIEDIANSGIGQAADVHDLTGINTVAGSVGDPVYLSATAGGWTFTAPIGADQIQQEIGYVTVDNATTGAIRFSLSFSSNKEQVGTSGLQDLAVSTAKIAATAVDKNKINTDVAGAGISGGAGTALAIDLNQLSAAAVDVTADSIAIIDANDSNASKKESIGDLVTALAGNGMQNTASQLAVSAALDEAQTFFGATDISGAEAETLTDTSNADALHVHESAGISNLTEADNAAAATQTISANDFIITHNNKGSVHLTLTGNYNSSTVTAIADGTVVGQKLTIIVVDDGGAGRSILIRDNANTKLRADGTTNTGWFVSFNAQKLLVEWDGSDWIEILRGNRNKDTGKNAGSGGGFNNLNSGTQAGSVGGNGNTNSGTDSGSAGGFQNTNASRAGSAGGYGNINSGTYSGSVGGLRGRASLLSQISHAAGNFNAVGDAQGSELIAREVITHSDANWHTLLLDGSGATVLPDILADTFWTFEIQIAGTTVGGGAGMDVFSFLIEGSIENDNGTTTLNDYTVTTLHKDDSDFDAKVEADDTNDSLLVRVIDTTSGGAVVRWVTTIKFTSVSFP